MDIRNALSIHPPDVFSASVFVVRMRVSPRLSLPPRISYEQPHASSRAFFLSLSAGACSEVNMCGAQPQPQRGLYTKSANCGDSHWLIFGFHALVSPPSFAMPQGSSATQRGQLRNATGAASQRNGGSFAMPLSNSHSPSAEAPEIASAHASRRALLPSHRSSMPRRGRLEHLRGCNPKRQFPCGCGRAARWRRD